MFATTVGRSCMYSGNGQYVRSTDTQNIADVCAEYSRFRAERFRADVLYLHLFR